MEMKNERDAYVITVPAEEIVIREGEVCPVMYKILNGRAEMYTGYGTENEVLLAILKEGQCFGEFGLLAKKPALYTVVAYSELMLFKVDEDKMYDFVRENPSSVLQIMRSMAKTMTIMQHQITQLGSELDEKNKATKRMMDRNKELLEKYLLGMNENMEE